jgi:hypothetical protein
MPPDNSALSDMAERLAGGPVRDLFTRFCSEVLLFSDDIAVETTPFEVRFTSSTGFRVHVSPYRDLFRVSIDSPNPCDFRVNTPGGYVSALDLSLKSFLDARARTAPDTDAAESGAGDDPSALPCDPGGPAPETPRTI